MSIDVQGIDRITRMTQSLASGILAATERGMEQGANLMVSDAQKNVHVITGRLKNSIKILKKGRGQVTWGSELSYAGFEEFGNIHRPPHPYLRPAAQKNADATRRMVMQEVGKLIKA